MLSRDYQAFVLCDGKTERQNEREIKIKISPSSVIQRGSGDAWHIKSRLVKKLRNNMFAGKNLQLPTFHV